MTPRNTKEQDIPGELLLKREIASLLRVSVRTIENDPDFPTIRIGRCVRYRIEDVLSYLKKKSAN